MYIDFKKSTEDDDITFFVVNASGKESFKTSLESKIDDDTRVVLNDCLETDYINASYVKDDTDERATYIACQAPKDDTCYEFWLMILQCRVQSIVMLCNIIEQDKVKCHRYYPDQGETANFGDIAVMCSETSVISSFTKRILLVTKEGQDSTVQVRHFHFSEWADFGAPKEPETMLNLCLAVRNATTKSENGMVAVHCSAGIGRTGTFIAVDILMRHIEQNRKISVFNTLVRLREQRMNMVQTQPQYKYIYQCLKYVLENQSKYLRQGKSSRKRRSNTHLSKSGSVSSVSLSSIGNS